MDKQELKHANEITKEVKAEEQAVADAVCIFYLFIILLLFIIISLFKNQKLIYLIAGKGCRSWCKERNEGSCK